MKQLIFSLLFMLNNLQITLSQQCYPDHLLINSQDDITNFITEYPECNTILGHLIIDDEWSDDLTDLSELSQITRVEGKLNVEKCLGLTNLQGLENITFAGSLKIKDNIYLQTLQGLESIDSVNGDLILENLLVLDNLAPLSNLKYVRYDLEIVNNDSISNLVGLEQINEIGWGFRVSGNNNLIDLEGIQNLEKIVSYLIIHDNDNLQSLNSLLSLVEVNNTIAIRRNNKLISLEGLENIDLSSSPTIYIQDNDTLTFCNQNNICSYIASGGDIDISNIQEGCLDNSNVINYCGDIVVIPTTVSELEKVVNDIAIYPNPGGNHIIIESNNLPIKTISISNNLGQLKLTLNNVNMNKINLSLEKFKSGVYFCKIKINNAIETKKLIVRKK